MTLYLLVLVFADGPLMLPTEPVAYSTRAVCEAAAADINAEKSHKQQWVAVCTPLVVPR